MDDKYIQDAELLIKDAKSRSVKDVVAKTMLPTQVGKSILPSFTFMQDGFKNLVSGMGGAQAKNTYTTYRTTFCFTDNLLYNLYESHGLSYKIASVVSKDATKNDIKIHNDTDNDLWNKWDDLNAIEILCQADIYRRFFGGAIIYMDIDDGKDLTEPLNENAIKSLRKLRVYSRTDVFFTSVNFTQDITDENYGQPEFYTIIPKYTTPFNIHYTRVIELKGKEVPSYLDNGYRYYWGQSELEPLWETMKKVGAALENLDQLLYEMTIGIYKIKGLADKIGAGKWHDIKAIIDQTELAKSTIRSLLVDAEGTDYNRDSLNMSGVKDPIELLFKLLSGESFIPMIRLFGEQAGGLNNDASGELSGYYDEVKVWQKTKLKKPAQRIVNIINLSKEVKPVKDAIVEFESPYQLTEKEELENKKLQSDIDKIYVDMGAVSNAEIRELRFENDWSSSMNVSELESYNENMIEEENQKAEQQREAQLQMAQMQQVGENANQQQQVQKPNIIQKAANKLLSIGKKKE